MNRHEKPHSDRTDRNLIAISLLGLIVTGLLLSSDRMFNLLFERSLNQQNRPAIGLVSTVERDVRHRSSESMAWKNAEAGQSVRLGDSVFSGRNSSTVVQLNDGNKVSLEQNSLVKFQSINDLKLANLTLGKFRVSVNGKVKVAINGEVTDLEGQNSEVLVDLSSNRSPSFKIVKGKVQIKQKHQRQTISVDEPTVEPLSNLATVVPDPTIEPLAYNPTLYDFFEIQNSKLMRRRSPRRSIAFSVPISWKTIGDPTQVIGQLSGTPDFSNVHSSFMANSAQTSGIFNQSLTGTNYFRLSTNGMSWSKPYSFTVTPKPLATSPPHLEFQSQNLVILNDSAIAIATVQNQLTGYILEVSRHSDFNPSSTQVIYKTSPFVRFGVKRQGQLFVRARGVDQDLKLTETSDVIRLNVKRPELPEVPRLAMAEQNVTKGDWVQLNWPAANRAKIYHAKILNSKNQIISRHQMASTGLSFRADQTGTFRVRVTSTDEYGRKSKQYSEATLSVSKRPEPILQSKPVEVPLALREPTGEGTLSQKVDGEDLEYLNRKYSSSKLGVEGAGFTIYSQDQIDQQKKNPMAFMMGIRSMTWFGSQGVEGSIKSKVATVSSSEGGDVTPLQLEARYLHRWFISQTQFALLGGYEYYRNSTAGLFSPGYKLIKTGFSLAFPVFRHWDSGGEVLYGQGLESSQKYEVSGFLHYYLERKWSLGAGYRVHLFQAGSDEVTPLGIPYREGFGEGYSVLRWHY